MASKGNSLHNTIIVLLANLNFSGHPQNEFQSYPEFHRVLCFVLAIILFPTPLRQTAGKTVAFAEQRVVQVEFPVMK